MASGRDLRTRSLIGVALFVVLMILTVVEWLGAIYAESPMLVLGPVVTLKAAVIVVGFMHIGELRHPEEEL